MAFRIIDHTADAGIEVEADTLPGLFEDAARAMFSLMLGEGEVERRVGRTVRIEASDPEELMFKWLNELLFLAGAERLALDGFDVEEAGLSALKARVSGEPIDPGRHSLELEIKAATYHELEVARRGDRYFARVIFDV